MLKNKEEKNPQRAKIVFLSPLFVFFSSENVNPYIHFVFITPSHSLSSNLLFAFFPEKSLLGRIYADGQEANQETLSLSSGIHFS